jgi:hypothetical protein
VANQLVAYGLPKSAERIQQVEDLQSYDGDLRLGGYDGWQERVLNMRQGMLQPSTLCSEPRSRLYVGTVILDSLRRLSSNTRQMSQEQINEMMARARDEKRALRERAPWPGYSSQTSLKDVWQYVCNLETFTLDRLLTSRGK